MKGIIDLTGNSPMAKVLTSRKSSPINKSPLAKSRKASPVASMKGMKASKGKAPMKVSQMKSSSVNSPTGKSPMKSPEGKSPMKSPMGKSPMKSPKGEGDKLLKDGDKLLPDLEDSPKRAMKAPTKTIEERFQKKTPLEHVLLRPDSYVGSVEPSTEKLYVYDSSKKVMVMKSITYVPALFKIFDEILVNAADNYQRDPKNMDEIRVSISAPGVKNPCIKIRNNGRTLPLVKHKQHKMYVPELVFGNLLTSDNYDDSEKKVVGGRNGYGAKLCNIFSNKFVIECCDGKKTYKQQFENNMHKKKPFSLTNASSKSPYTEIVFYPDLTKFKGMTDSLSKDVYELLERRVYDVAGSTNEKVKVYLNGSKIPVKGFEEYVDLYLRGGASSSATAETKLYEKGGQRWEVAVCVSDTQQFQQVSFVNSIHTSKGGTHVQHVTDMLVDALKEKVNAIGKRQGSMEIKGAHIKNHLFVFVNCLVENPAFDSQTKETLKTDARKFGSVCKLPGRFYAEMVKKETGFLDTILEWAKAKEKIDLGKQVNLGRASKKKLLGIPKLEDANEAGGPNAAECTLILTEGDSAKALAVAGLSIIGRDKFGVFPLKGKPLNVREAKHNAIKDNQEIAAILKIMGLDPTKKYNDVTGLRYGSIMLMADQDYDGSHIKGLILNMIAHWWPSLLEIDGFLKEFVTPIIKVQKGNEKESFFSVQEYEEWLKKKKGAEGWKTKYYKGLGTSTSAEAKEYFSDMAEHEIEFEYDTDAEENLDLAFNKTRADDRKNWIQEYDDEEDHVDHSMPTLTYSDFVNQELIKYATYDLHRMIPSIMDGLKPSQRKVLYSCFKRRLTSDVKVAQLTGYVAENAAYHHGEASLQSTIINMAQDYVGSNNLNLLVPSGQFGTRMNSGKDAASARYVYTRLQPYTSSLFHPDDMQVLQYLVEEGQKIEPRYYVPIIPMVLVNGAEGIGSGWSTFVPNYNPRDLIAELRKYLAGKPMSKDLTPWYRNYKGNIKKVIDAETKRDYFIAEGQIEKTSDTIMEITELSIKGRNSSTQDYKEFLQSIMPGGDEKKKSTPLIQNFREYHTENAVHFILSMTKEQMARLESKGITETLKLRSNLATSNLVLWDADGQIKKYANAMGILKEFAPIRLEMYKKRKAHLLVLLRRQCEILRMKKNFIMAVINGSMKVGNVKKDVLVRMLSSKKFLTLAQIKAKYQDEFTKREDKENKDEKEDAEDEDNSTDYDYLLSMAIWSLTYERVQQLQKELADKEAIERKLQKQTPAQLWEADLASLEKELDKLDKADQNIFLKVSEARMKHAGGKKSGMKGDRKRSKSPKSPRSKSPSAVGQALSASPAMKRRRLMKK